MTLLRWHPPSRPRVLASVWVSLELALLCLDCEAVFKLGGESACPACGSRESVPLAKWLTEDRG